MNKENRQRPDPVVASFSGPDDAQLYVGEVIRKEEGYSFEPGEQWVLGVVASALMEGAASIYSVYAPRSLKFRGCMPASMFNVTGEYEEPPEPEVVEVPEEKQLSLFDF